MTYDARATFVSHERTNPVSTEGNDATRFFALPRDEWPTDPTAFARLLRPAVGVLRGKLSSRSPGEAMLALVSPQGRIESTAVLGIERVATVVIGRHSAADLQGDSPAFALRQAIAVRRPSLPHAIEVIDLASAAGCHLLGAPVFGRAHLELPFVVRAGAYTVLAARPEDVLAEPAAFLARALQPRAAVRVLPAREPPAWLCTLEHSAYREDHLLTASRLGRGVLIGRQGRCELPSNKRGYQLSRVHAYVFAIEDRTYVVDTASLFGLVHERRGPVRYKRLEHGDAFTLGDVRAVFSMVT